jgi:tRNA (cmo5U34)-methyltransferase
MVNVNKWREETHVTDYLSFADAIPHRSEGESALLQQIPAVACRILDVGCGDGRLLAVVLQKLPGASGVGIDFSPVMLERARAHFAGDSRVSIIEHNLDSPLPELGLFDAVVSSFAIHHVIHERKRLLYEEIFRALNPAGVFCNLEHVSSPTRRLHLRFLEALGKTEDTDDPSNKLLDVETQLDWLRAIGFADVDCHWKWLELALLAGVRPV